jgi:hypothetical protein
MDIEFPVFVCTKDSGEIQRFASVYDLQGQLEKIDVENAEYLAWDKNGRPISLAVQRPVWLRLDSPSGLEQAALKDCLERFAAAAGAGAAVGDATPPEFNRVYEQIEAVVSARSRRGILSRLIRRR